MLCCCFQSCYCCFLFICNDWWDVIAWFFLMTSEWMGAKLVERMRRTNQGPDDTTTSVVCFPDAQQKKLMCEKFCFPQKVRFRFYYWSCVQKFQQTEPPLSVFACRCTMPKLNAFRIIVVIPNAMQSLSQMSINCNLKMVIAGGSRLGSTFLRPSVPYL